MIKLYVIVGVIAALMLNLLVRVSKKEHRDFYNDFTIQINLCVVFLWLPIFLLAIFDKKINNNEE